MCCCCYKVQPDLYQKQLEQLKHGVIFLQENTAHYCHCDVQNLMQA